MMHGQKGQDQQLLIVKMTAGHIPQISAIETEAFSTPWSAQAFADTLEMDNALFYTALSDGQVAGYCGLYLAADEGEIATIAVAPAYRRQKIAELLVQKVLAQAHARGAARIFLEVRRSNAPAISLYEKTGFRTIYERKGYYSFPTEDALVMMRGSADKL